MKTRLTDGKAGNRKIDGFGRITIPKNMRDKLEIEENDEFEIGITTIEGKTIIYLYKEDLGNKRRQELLKELRRMGVNVNA